MIVPKPAAVAQIAAALLAWFDRHKRDLPWRRDRDPYHIWLSEIMLQQTQVAAVIPYYERFIDRFPTITSLANASESEVLRLWEGLGYYKRAKQLHKAAQMLASAYGDAPPRDPAVWEPLPGIGRYTHGAILSQAYELPFPILEANSRRILTRIALDDRDPNSAESKHALWNLAAALLPTQRIGDYNQALMELGALVCTSDKPSCDACPIRQWCQARLGARQHEIPLRTKPKTITETVEVAVMIHRAGKLLLCRRPESGRWPGLWEFPRGEVAIKESLDSAAKRIAMECTAVSIDDPERLTSIKHSVTRFRIQLLVMQSNWVRGDWTAGAYDAHAWITLSQMGDYPCSSPQRKIVKLVQEAATATTLFG